ncbi:hypothetical protein ACN4EG_08280 [Alkalinema pantanalense CENA528]|uniref:hypothetical protein n=1 Tax=Alkalinema pantanalense TaxID=1620705 RepID=UPI003D6F3299
MLYPTRSVTAHLYGSDRHCLNALPTRIETLTELDIEVLDALGIRGLVLDLDQNWSGSLDRSASPQVRNWFLKAQATGLQLFALVNEVNSDHHWSQPLNLPIIYTANRALLWVFREAVTCMNLTAKQVVIISDRLPSIWLDAWLSGCAPVQLESVSQPNSLHG